MATPWKDFVIHFATELLFLIKIKQSELAKFTEYFIGKRSISRITKWIQNITLCHKIVFIYKEYH